MHYVALMYPLEEWRAAESVCLCVVVKWRPVSRMQTQLDVSISDHNCLYTNAQDEEEWRENARAGDTRCDRWRMPTRAEQIKPASL